jgi:hypothetical protein
MTPSTFRDARRLAFTAALSAGVLAGCAGGEEPRTNRASPGPGFAGAECNGVTDPDVTAAAGSGMFTRVIANDTGCFWQENTMIGSVGAGMGISTWWYRGSDIAAERSLEEIAGRTVTEVSVGGLAGFRASDDNACTVYLDKGADVMIWSIQTLNPVDLPDLCGIVDGLAQRGHARVS